MTDERSHVLSIKGYILLWVVTLFAPLGIQYYSVISPIWTAGTNPYDNVVSVFLLGVRVVGNQLGSIWAGVLVLWIAVPSFLANLFIWKLDRGKTSTADYSWTAWLTFIAFLVVFEGMMFSDFIVGVIPTPITAIVQHLIFKRIYNRSKHHA